MKLSDEWFTVLSQDESGRLIYVNGRTDIAKLKKSGKYKIRIEITLPYEGDESGMPVKEDAVMISNVHRALVEAVESDLLGVLTGNHIGGDAKYWVFYVKDEKVFQERLNDALAQFPILPLEFLCEPDPGWEEYLDMLEMNTNVSGQ